jgi:uncharacterized protein YigE (DUF2233 family)
LKFRPPSALLAALFVLPAIALGDWTVVSSKTSPGPAKGIEVVEAELSRAEPAGTARLVAVLFDNRSHTLRVVESPKPGEAALADVMESRGALAGVNGGYFEPDFTPVGLVVAEGKTRQPFKKAKLLSGFIAVSPKGSVSILRSGRFDPKPGAYREALQCGPMLVENSSPVAGLNAEKIARRTVVATGSGRRVALVYLTAVTLADAAKILATPEIFGTWKPASALNLDGGSSSGLWVQDGVSRPEIKRVRNFLELVPGR